MTGFSFVSVENRLEFRTSEPGAPHDVQGAWRGVELAPRVQVHAPLRPAYDPAALHEEAERWDGLS